MVTKRVVAGAMTAMIVVAGADGWRATSKNGGPRRVPRIPHARVRRKPKYPFGPNREVGHYMSEIKMTPTSARQAVEFMAPIARPAQFLASSHATKGVLQPLDDPAQSSDGHPAHGSVDLEISHSVDPDPGAELTVASAIGQSISDWAQLVGARLSIERPRTSPERS